MGGFRSPWLSAVDLDGGAHYTATGSSFPYPTCCPLCATQRLSLQTLRLVLAVLHGLDRASEPSTTGQVDRGVLAISWELRDRKDLVLPHAYRCRLTHRTEGQLEAPPKLRAAPRLPLPFLKMCRCQRGFFGDRVLVTREEGSTA
jgi:hypothetical protein